MDFDKKKRQWSIVIVLLTILFTLICSVISVVPTVKAVMNYNKLMVSVDAEDTHDEAVFVEEDFFTEVTEDVIVLEPAEVDEITDGSVMSMDAVLSVEEMNEDAQYDYSTESSDSFSDAFVDDGVDNSVETPELPSLENSMEVSWKSLVSTETVNKIYNSIQKDESHDDDTQKRCMSNILSALTQAQDHMTTVEGKTSRLEYELSTDTNTQELMLTLRVFDDSDALCYNSIHALGVISNEGDV